MFFISSLESKGKIFFTGVGKNGHVAAKAASTFSSIGLPCFYINPVDSVHGDMGVINQDDIIVAISKGGNTEELIHFLHHVKHTKTARLFRYILIRIIILWIIVTLI